MTATRKATVIVTGGSGGLGSAVVHLLLSRGWRVVVPWVVEKELARLPSREGLELIEADLFEHEAAERVVAAAVAADGQPLRGLVNLVGGFAAGGRVHETALEEFEAQFRLNLRPTYLLTQAAVPELLRHGGGSIVCVGSRAAFQPFRGAAGYIASKAAVIAFAQAVSAEYLDDGIRCNAIVPSVIDTPANRASMPESVMARAVAPAAIADVVAWLTSDAAAPVVGAVLPVYGTA